MNINQLSHFDEEFEKFGLNNRVSESKNPQIVILAAPDSLNDNSEQQQEQENEQYSNSNGDLEQEAPSDGSRLDISSSENNMMHERPIQTINLPVQRRVSRVSGMLRLLRRRYRWFYNKKCAAFFIAQLLIMILYATNALSRVIAFRLSLIVISIATYFLLVERSRLERERNMMFMELARIIHIHRQRQLSQITENNQENELEQMLRGINLTVTQRSEIREHFRLLNQIQNSSMNPSPANNLLHAPSNRALDFIGMRLAERFLMQSNIDFGQLAESQGLSKQQIESLMPMQKYVPAQDELGEGCTTEAEGESGENCCTICLEPFTRGQEIRVSPCSHVFHVKCIDVWAELKGVCPNCKRELR